MTKTLFPSLLFLICIMVLAPGACSRAPAVTAPPAVGFAATDDSILEGDSTALFWIVTDAASVQIDQGIGSVVPTVGSVVVSPASDTTYVLTASNSIGSVTQSVTIKVTSPTPLNILDLREITLKPLGEVDPNIPNVLEERMKKIYGCPVETVYQYFDLEEAYNPDRQQYLANMLLDQLETLRAATGEKVLGLINGGLYARNGHNILGQAVLGGQVSVISVTHLSRDYFSRLPPETLLLNRATSTGIHELGHTLGVEHCLNPTCPMYYTDTMDMDYKQATYCDVCRFTLER